MKKHIYFVTTNSRKFQEISHWLAELAPEIELEQSQLDLPEIQSLDPKEVAVAKARDAWQVLQKPLLIDDEGLYLDKYPLFPGTITKLIRQAIGIRTVVEIAGENRNASIINNLVYIESSDSYHLFQGVTKGVLSDPVGPDPDHKLKSTDLLIPHWGYTDILTPNAYNKTFDELRHTEDARLFHYRYQSLKQFIAFFEQSQ